MEIQLSHDDNIDSERAEEGTQARRRHDADRTAPAPDAAPESGDVSGGDDAVGNTDHQVDRQQVDELAEVEEILEGEIDNPRHHGGSVTEHWWEGPLPPPQALEYYEQVLPGAADRVLRMAERQVDIREARESTVRMAMEGEVSVQTTLAEGDRDALKRGQYLAAGISALVAGLSFAGMFLTPWAAVGFAVPLAQVAAALVRTISDGQAPSPDSSPDEGKSSKDEPSRK